MSGINAEIIDYLKLEKQVRLDGLEMMDKSAEIPQRLLKEVSIFDRWVEHLANGVTTEEKQCNLPVVINWVAITERLPEEEWGDYMVCLENNAMFKANYSRIGTERWLIVGVGDTKETNPVKYWAELPEPPCL